MDDVLLGRIMYNSSVAIIEVYCGDSRGVLTSLT